MTGMQVIEGMLQKLLPHLAWYVFGMYIVYRMYISSLAGLVLRKQGLHVNYKMCIIYFFPKQITYG